MRYRFVRRVSNVCSKLVEVTLRAIVPILVFSVCVLGLLHYMGVPLPSAHDLLNGFEGLSRVAKVFS